jgi:hypothetical protein
MGAATGSDDRERRQVGTPIAEQEFIAYAEAQAAYGQHLLAVHRRDSTNCCRLCGRPHPCDERARGGQLLVHFDHWHPVELKLARPYVPADGGGSPAREQRG